jgi:hypothetical protein
MYRQKAKGFALAPLSFWVMCVWALTPSFKTTFASLPSIQSPKFIGSSLSFAPATGNGPQGFFASTGYGTTSAAKMYEPLQQRGPYVPGYLTQKIQDQVVGPVPFQNPPLARAAALLGTIPDGVVARSTDVS